MRIPTFKFHGSKCRIAKWLFERVNFPIHNYYEPFAGRGNAFFYFASKFKYNQAYLNDLYLSHFLVALRDYDGNYNFVPDYIDTKVYNRLNQLPCDFERSLAESFCAYNGTFWGCGINVTNSPYHKSANKHNKKSTIMRMKNAKQLLHNVQITNWDFAEFLHSFTFNVNDLIYCDPPYMNMTHKSLVGPDINHNKLVKILKTLPCKVVLSGYDNDIYNRKLLWNTRQYVRASCGRNSGGGTFKATEKVWENF